MSDKSKIEWTETTWNPVTGCSKVSQGCKNCYALRDWPRLAANPQTVYYGRAFTDVGTHAERLEQPLRWTRPRRVFVNSMSDLFHKDVPDEFIDRVFAVMALSPQHQFQVLTKRPKRMRDYTQDRYGTEWGSEALSVAIEDMGGGDEALNWSPPLPNVWLGVSVERQKEADERIPLLLETPAAVRWLSCEPLLGPINVRGYLMQGDRPGDCARCGVGHGFTRCPNYGGVAPAREPRRVGDPGCPSFQRKDFAIGWVVVGGESGPRARPMRPDWARSLRDQCAAAGVPYFFKQWGEWAPGECARGTQTRTERVATWFNGGWHFGSQTPSQGAECHRDDEPDLFRLGKKAAGRTLDGRTHDEYPGEDV